MKSSILFNIEAIFFPIKYKNLRDNRQSHLTETLAILWPIMIISSLWELLILTLRPGQLNHYITFFILLKTFLLPLTLLLEIGFCYLSIALVANDSYDDNEIEAILGQFLAPKILNIMPFLGIPLASLVSNINLFFCLNQKIGALNSVIVLILPILLSIFFLLILIFCLALLFVTLIGL